MGYIHYIILLATALADVLPGKEDGMILSVKQMRLREAESFCEQQGATLFVPNSIIMQAHFVSNAAKVGIQSSWIGLYKKDLQGVQFLDSHAHKDMILSEKGNCGYINFNGTSVGINTTECRSLSLGYLCQIPDLHRCDQSFGAVRQFKVGRKCLQLNTEKRNWFEARWSCFSQGYHLATFKDITDVSTTKTTIANKYGQIGAFWVGARKMDYFRNELDLYAAEDVPVFWHLGQPMSSPESCVAAMKSEESYYWVTTKCNARHQVVCMNYPKAHMLNQEVRPAERRFVLVIIILSAMVSVLLVTSFVFSVVYLRSRRIKRMNGLPSEYIQVHDETSLARKT